MTRPGRKLALLLFGAFLAASAMEFVVHDIAGTDDESACVICQVAHQPATTAPTSEVPEPEPTVAHAPDVAPALVAVGAALLVDAPSRAPPA